MSQSHAEPRREIGLPVLLGLAAASGAGHALALPPHDLGGLAFVALVPLVVGLWREPRPRRAAAAGLVFGLVSVVAAVHWIPTALIEGNGFGPRSAWLLALGVFAWFGIGFAFLPLVSERLVRRGLPDFLSLPLAWVTMETLRDALLPGLSWTLYGHTQHAVLPMLQLAELAGAPGLSFGLVLINALLADAWVAIRQRAGRRRIAIPLLAAVLLGSLAFGLGAIRLIHADRVRAEGLDASIPVAVAQLAVPQSERWQPEQAWPRIDALLALSREAARDGAMWIVWPETAIEIHLDKLDGLASAVTKALGDRPGRFLIAGVPREETAATAYYNSAVLIDPRGALVDLYDKRILYPISEYVPGWMLALPGASRVLASQLRWAPYSPGREGPSLLAATVPVGVMICVEGARPETGRARVREGAEVLIQLANDAVVPSASAAAQHFAIVRFRAVENRRSLIRASNLGVGAIVAASGRVMGRIDRDQRGFALGRVVPGRGATPYVRVGWLFPWICVGVTGVVASIGRRGERRERRD